MLMSNADAAGDLAAHDDARLDIAKDKRYIRLRYLLQQTTVYSKFLADKLSQQDLADPSATDGSLPSPLPTPHSKPLFVQPALFTGGALQRFQLEGVEWLVSLYENGLNGILADEMGLGKTVQCIGFLAFLAERGVCGPFLVVAPLSTLRNWHAEFARFVPSLPVVVYHGDAKERAALRKDILGRVPIVITSYEMVLKDAGPLFRRLTWKFLVIDEGHRIKNINCKLVRELEAVPSLNRLLLTGTPLQNNLAELWSLLHFLLPDVFDDWEAFESWFMSIGNDNGDMGMPQEQEAQVVSALHSILKPFLLRRLKEDVLPTLPPKRELVVRCLPTRLQSELSGAVLRDRLHQKLAELHAETTDRGIVEDGEHISESGPKALRLMNRSMQLRKIANDPRLFHVGTTADSSKMLVFLQLINAFTRGGHRVLVFSQMTRVLDIISDELDELDVHYVRIDGASSEEQRRLAIESFSVDPSIPVFLLSTRSGGLGVNLVAADTVIMYDSDWNPQADRQACDRVHRIGQTRPVLVVRLRMAGSIEEERMAVSAGQKEHLEQLVIARKRFKGRSEYLAETHADDPRRDAVAASERRGRAAGSDAVPEMPSHKVLSDTEMHIVMDRSVVDFEETAMLRRHRAATNTILDRL